MNKICSKCHDEKLLDDFHNCTRNKDGKDNMCIKCVNKVKRIRYAKNKEKINTYKRKYWKENKEKRSIISKKWYEKNKENLLIQWKETRDENPQIHRDNNHKYYINNKEKVIKRNNINTKKRIKIDPLFRITKNLRGRINTLLRGKSKSRKTLKLLGCSLNYYKIYLEEQFRDGISWKNYGSYWHIDHIIPCSNFNLMLAEEQQKCFNFSNTQPLLVKENLKKHAKLFV